MSKYVSWVAGLLVVAGGLSAQEAKKPGFLGVDTVSVRTGALLRDVLPDSPAAKAGLKNGDVVTKVDKDAVQNSGDLRKAIAAKKAGDKLTLVLTRNGKEQTITVTLGEPTAATPPTPPAPPQVLLGVNTVDVTAAVKAREKLAVDSGALVTGLYVDSPAAKGGVKLGDVITKVGDTDVKTTAELRAAVAKVGAGKEANLQVQRGKDKVMLKTTLGGGPASKPPTPPDAKDKKDK